MTSIRSSPMSTMGSIDTLAQIEHLREPIRATSTCCTRSFSAPASIRPRPISPRCELEPGQWQFNCNFRSRVYDPAPRPKQMEKRRDNKYLYYAPNPGVDDDGTALTTRPITAVRLQSASSLFHRQEDLDTDGKGDACDDCIDSAIRAIARRSIRKTWMVRDP